MQLQKYQVCDKHLFSLIMPFFPCYMELRLELPHPHPKPLQVENILRKFNIQTTQYHATTLALLICFSLIAKVNYIKKIHVLWTATLLSLFFFMGSSHTSSMNTWIATNVGLPNFIGTKIKILTVHKGNLTSESIWNDTIMHNKKWEPYLFQFCPCELKGINQCPYRQIL